MPGRPRAEVLALLLVGPAEASRCAHTVEAAHRVVALLDRAKMLLDPVVEIAAGAVRHRLAQGLADRARVRVAAVGGHALPGLPGDRKRPPEELPRRDHVAALTQAGVDQVALAIDRPVQGAPRPVDLHGGLVRVPRRAGLTVALGAEVLREQRGEACLPVADGLVGEHEAAGQEHLGEVAQAALVPEPPQDDEQDDIGRVLQVVGGRAGPLVADPAAGVAAEGALVERGAPGLFGGRSGGAVGTGHRHLLYTAANVATLSDSLAPTRLSSAS